MHSLKFDIQTICQNAVKDQTVMNQIAKSADNMLCVFVNESAFQAAGAFITIRDVAKCVLPSISKRQLEIGVNAEQEGLTSSPPIDLFAFEV